MHSTTVDRKSPRELVVTRTFDAPASRVFEAWTVPALFRQWWTPKSFGISFLSCEIDARTGGGYRFTFSHPSAKEPMAFFGKYLEATPPSRLVWTNDEGGDNGAVSTLTLEQRGAATLLTLHDLHPSKEALDEAIASQSTSGYEQQFEQLDALLAERH